MLEAKVSSDRNYYLQSNMVLKPFFILDERYGTFCQMITTGEILKNNLRLRLQDGSQKTVLVDYVKVIFNIRNLIKFIYW